jgi:hypothetical protein
MSIDYDERIEQLDEAQEKLKEAISLIEEAVDGLDCEANTKAYLIDHLKIMASEGHGYLSRDLNLDKVRETIEEERDDAGTFECEECCERYDTVEDAEECRDNDRKQNENCPCCSGSLGRHPALSRKDNHTNICSDCGTKEALDAMITAMGRSQ